MKILFVCLGNICRSPLAEELFRKNYTLAGLGNFFTTDSCGTGNWHQGELPDRRTRETALERGVELRHRARQIKQIDFDTFDLLLVMDQNNLKDVLRLNPGMKHKIKLIGELSEKYKNQEVPDPYYGEKPDFVFVHEMLDHITSEIVHQFKP